MVTRLKKPIRAMKRDCTLTRWTKRPHTTCPTRNMLLEMVAARPTSTVEWVVKSRNLATTVSVWRQEKPTKNMVPSSSINQKFSLAMRSRSISNPPAGRVGRPRLRPDFII